MHTPSRGKRMISGAVVLLVLGVVGLVYAAWTTNGTGSGYAKAGQAQNLSTLDVSAQTTATLYPGSNGDVLLKIHNPNPYPVTVTGVNGNGSVSASAAGCNASSVTYTDQVTSISVPANGDSAQTTLSNAAQMSNAANDQCQNAIFTIGLNLVGASG